MSRIALAALMLSGALASGCATYRPAQPQPQPPVVAQPGAVQYGQVQNIETVRAEPQSRGGGALIGGVLGAVVGNTIGSGSGNGRTAATMIGAFGGAVLGDQIEKRNQPQRDFYRVSIRTDRGEIRSFDYQQLADLRIGDRVRIENNLVYRD